MSNINNAINTNKKHWDLITSDHLKSEYYPIEKIKKGELSLSKIELNDIGNIKGLYGVHLQCGIGLDTISLSRMGANMVGFDISRSCIKEANAIAAVCKQDIQFVESDIYQIPSTYFNNFDFVYTSHGVLRWLPNLYEWATLIYNLLKPGGIFYIFEIHPLVYKLKNSNEAQIDFGKNYFDESIKIKSIDQSHASNVVNPSSKDVAHVDWTLESIITSMLNSGLFIKSFKEFAGCSYNRHNLFPKQKDNLWYPKNRKFPIPLSFSIKAIRNN